MSRAPALSVAIAFLAVGVDCMRSGGDATVRPAAGPGEASPTSTATATATVGRRSAPCSSATDVAREDGTCAKLCTLPRDCPRQLDCRAARVHAPDTAAGAFELLTVCGGATGALARTCADDEMAAPDGACGKRCERDRECPAGTTCQPSPVVGGLCLGGTRR